MAVTIPRTPWIDDDGTGTTGTVLNNAIKTELYNQIDTALGQVLPNAGNVTITGNLNLTGGVSAQTLEAYNLTTTGGGVALPPGAPVFFNGMGGAVKIHESGGALIAKAGDVGGVYLPSDGSAWTALSDARHKTDFAPFEDAAAKVRTLRAGTGRYLADAPTCRRSFLMGQDVAAVLPEAVDTAADGTLSLRYTDVIPLLVAAVQELAAKVDAR